MKSKGKIILIDGNSLLYRAFFAMPHFSTLENQPTNAVYGFTMMLLRIIDEVKPDVILVAFDAPAKTFRHEEYKEYKAHRKSTPDDLRSQGPLAREMVDAFNIPIFEIEGFEADDVVGTLARKAESDGYEVIIVTGDLDALQLVDDNIKVMTTIKGVTETVIYDEQTVEERYGIKPNQLPDYKGLKGDPSDNIPGVPGIGDKIARKLISEYGNLENLLDHINDIKEKRIQGILSESVDAAKMSKYLATIVTDVPLDIDLHECSFRKPDIARLRDMFKRLEFRSLVKRLPEEESIQQNLFAEPKIDETPLTIHTLASRSEIDSLITSAISSRAVAIKIAGTTSHGVSAEPLSMAISVSSSDAYFIQFDTSANISLIDFKPIFESDDIVKHGYDIKYDLEIIRCAGSDIKGPMFDTMLAAYLLNPARTTNTIEELAYDYAGLELESLDNKKNKQLELIGMGDVSQTLAAQVNAIRKLVPILGNKLAEDGLGDLMANIEMPLVPILADMELAGISIDTEWLHNLSALLGSRINELESGIYQLAGTDFNISSPKQLQTILFDKLGLPAAKKTKTGYSTDADTLAALAPAHEIVAKILEYRELTKLKSTYADSLPKLINPHTNRIHTSLNQAVASTGRLSSSEPNLQNIPIKTEYGREIRKAFIASPGNLLVSADYSQIELRILAHVSNDPELVRAYQEDLDIHTRTAMSLFHLPEDEIASDMRRQAKTVNFAVIYGMSDYGLSRELNIPVNVAKHYIDSYFMQYPGVKWYTSAILAKAREAGYVESLLGRRRYFPELNSPNRSIREFAERAAVNMPIQGTAADIVKIAMIQIHQNLEKSGCKAKLVLQVHDELVFDAPEDEMQTLIPMIRTVMENAYKLSAPLKVEIKVGSNWCIAQPVSADDHIDII